MRFATALLVKNELGRYLAEVLDHHAKFGPLVILDDGSTDGTYEFCRNHPATLVCEQRTEQEAWGRESPARARLWDLAAERAEWVLICDADQLLIGDPLALCQASQVNAWAFALYDCWSPDRVLYREDRFWRGHLHPRAWLFCPHRTPTGYMPQWSTRGVHCGHAPDNFPLQAGVVHPESMHWLHLGYATEQDRAGKLGRYRQVRDQLTVEERAHAESIADSEPNLRVLPSQRTYTVVVGSSVRKPLDVLTAHLASLESQRLPERVSLKYAFVPDYENPADPALPYLSDWVQKRSGVILQGVPPIANDFVVDQVTHHWTPTAMNRVGQNKDRILAYAMAEKADAIWLVDSDLVVDPMTLWNLWYDQREVVSAVFWTRWQRSEKKLHAAPNVWLAGVYEPFQSGRPVRGYTTEEFRAALVNRTLTQVWGLGACTLIRADVVQKGVSFRRHPALPSGGLWDGEDRHFCAWATALHVSLWADPWPDIYHVYHPGDEARIPEVQARFAQGRGAHPELGDSINVALYPLEDPAIGTHHLRCRLGDGLLLPDLELQLLAMRLGERAIVPVQFPAHHELVAYRGQQRLIETVLIDFKPMGFPPVLEDEMLSDSTLTVVRDATTLSREQHRRLEVMADD